MKRLTKYLPLLGLCALSLLSCKKDKVEPALPAATMEGKNTFGAMVNGRLWVPKGRPNIYQTNLDVVYEPRHLGGWLNIVTYRKGEHEEYMYLFMTQLDHEGMYSLDNPDAGTATFKSDSCNYGREPETYRKGKLEITKLDLKNGIIAGKFEFTLAKPGCDTIRVTEGRFDKKLF